MKIAIDCSKAINERAGVSRYTWETAFWLPKLFSQDHFFYFFNFLRGAQSKRKLINKLVSGSDNISTKIYRLPGNLKEKIFPSKFSLLNFWLQECDIYHATEFLSFDLGLKIPQILTVHDLTMIKFPQHRGLKECARHGKMLKLACKNSSKIIAVSEATKKDIIKYFSIPEDKISVIYEGYDAKFRQIADKAKIKSILVRYKINFPYILFVSTIEPRKNVKNLILAFEQFSKTKTGENYHLVLVGGFGWNTEEIIKTHDKSIAKTKIHFLDYVVDEDLVYFYNGADLFCYPSIYEGFGLPPLEAMACGVPVITSDTSSLPEVVRDAGKLIDPKNVDEIAKAINKVLSNRNIAKKMSQDGLIQAKKFSWEKNAKETYKIYEEVLRNEK